MRTHLPIAELSIPLERDVFVRSLLRHLAGTLQDVVGLEQASGFISVVGQHIGDEVDGMYRRALRVERLDRIVLGNRRCPFGDEVLDRPSLCMMTSNVFGAIAAENLGYAKVVIDKTIAQRDPECRVVVHLRPTEEAEAATGREYVRR